MEQFTVSLSEQDRQRLREFALERKWSVAQAAREIIIGRLDAADAPPPHLTAQNTVSGAEANSAALAGRTAPLPFTEPTPY